ncbi:MAG: hypothetical protein ACO1TE_11655 [Prosthecobacter sp.]
MNVTNRLLLRATALLACLVTCWALPGCTKSGEAKTRTEQEEAFQANFGFTPPASVTEIQYADHYARGVVDGDYEQWMRFTFMADVFDQIVKKNGYQRNGTSTMVSGPNKPEWWPQDHASQYVREGKDAASYLAHLWHDEKTGFVYWHQTWTD